MPIALVAGCYTPPDLPDDLDEIPLLPEGVCAESREAIVECTLDGDTFDVGACGEEAGERVRMLGLDAPEVAHDGEPADCWGDEAAAVLRAELTGRRITLSFDQSCIDTYGRTLAYVWIAADEAEGDTAGYDEGLLLNEWMLANGHARFYELDEALRLEDRLVAAEADARARGLGLWGACEDAAR